MRNFSPVTVSIMAFAIAGLVWANEPTPATPSDAKLTTEPAKTLTLDLGNKVAMKLVLIPAGKFMMGRPPVRDGG